MFRRFPFWLLFALVALPPALAQTPLPYPTVTVQPAPYPVALPVHRLPGLPVLPWNSLGALQSQNALLQSQNALLQSQSASARAQVMALTAQNTLLDGQNSLLSAQVASLTAAANAPPPVFGAAYVNTTGRYVYWHYQVVGAHEYGTIPTGGYTSQAAYLQDITECAAMGGDGFSLDLALLDAATLDEVGRFFAAANQFNALHPVPAGSVNPAFTLFITLDCSSPSIEAPAPLAAAFLRFASDPAYTKVKDAAGSLRPRFSTYAGAGGTGWADCKTLWNTTLGLMKAGTNGLSGVQPFFVAGFEELPQVPGGPAPTDAQWVQGLLAGLADGDWEFANPNPPLGTVLGGSPLPGQEAKTAAVQAAGLYREASVRNPAWGAASQPRFYNEYCGGEGLKAWWVSVINTQKPRSVQVLTWNDYDEASWTTNADEGPTSTWPNLHYSNVLGFYPSRLGLQKLYAYYIQEYKTGQMPTLANDTVVAEYRTQTAAAAAAPTADPLGGIVYTTDDTGGGPGMSHGPDVAYLDLFLKKGAVVTLTCTPISPPQTHTNLVAFRGDSHGIYDPVLPFQNNETGETLQITGGTGWTPGNYSVTRTENRYGGDTDDGAQILVYVGSGPPANYSVRGGQGTLYPAGAVVPPLPPPALTTTRYVPAGHSSLRLPFIAGNQTITVSRDGQTVLTLPGQAIVGTAAIANGNYWTGTAHN